jgi:hypothetical protein
MELMFPSHPIGTVSAGIPVRNNQVRYRPSKAYEDNDKLNAGWNIDRYLWNTKPGKNYRE